ncbi:MAG: glycosyltransferase [Planctomycetes bacterium]|nr:glycosyltransferase [Planctomycetota bacterium]
MEKACPFLSIIIPTYNRSAQLAVCLKTLTKSSYPADHFEVIIVDDGSEISQDLVVASFRNFLNITLIRQAHAGVAIGRNTGAAKAKGEFLVFTDDDCQPAPNWLQELAAHFLKYPDCIIGGRTINILPDNIYSTASQLLISFLFGYYNTNPAQARFLNGSNLAVPKDLFLKLGGFDKRFFLVGAEEREFCARWMKYGFQMIYVPEILVYHSHELTFCTFLRQHFKYGRGAFRFHKARAERGRQRIQVEPRSFYLGLLCYPFMQKYRLRAPLLSILLAISHVSNVIGFFWERFIQNNKAEKVNGIIK